MPARWLQHRETTSSPLIMIVAREHRETTSYPLTMIVTRGATGYPPAMIVAREHRETTSHPLTMIVTRGATSYPRNDRGRGCNNHSAAHYFLCTPSYKLVPLFYCYPNRIAPSITAITIFHFDGVP